MSSTTQRKAPWLHRVLVFLLALALGVLLFWLIGFVLADIGDLEGPDYQTFWEQRIDPALADRQKTLAESIIDLELQRTELRQQQSVLSESTNNSQQTMNQLLDFQRLAIEKGVTPSEAEQQALAESQQRFLDNQRQFQQLNGQVSGVEEQLRQLQAEQRENQQRIATAEEPIRIEFQQLADSHRLRIAAIKLGVLVPLILLAGWLYLKHRHSVYRMMLYAYALAVAGRTGFVMHEYFPRPWFRYILIGVAIIVTGKVLIYLLRSAANPKPDLLQKRYRESYEHMLCPVCDYPIRRGPLRHLFWTRRSIRKMHVPMHTATTPSDEQPYTCPGCGTNLYEPCESCDAIRPTLLPACDHCGATRSDTK